MTLLPHVAVALLLTSVAGCATSQPAGPQTLAALRSECTELQNGPGVTYTVRLDTIERRVEMEDSVDPIVTMATDEFKAAAADADAVWWYDDSSDSGGMKTGEGGLIATEGCTVVAQTTVIVYN